MFLELIATFVAALGAAGIVLALNRLTGGRLPRWAMPVAAGLTMLAYTIWSEYSWDSRTRAQLPEGTAVFQTMTDSAFWKPWTLIWPQTKALAVVDQDGARTRPDTPDVMLVDLYLFARWRGTDRSPQLVDCTRAARAPVSDAALADPAAAEWQMIGADDPLITALCPRQG
ncbi:hypothetical protein [Lacimonas salitolerans]|uniref:Uncharacterized protein n=1 Tax=Lacimonas salitolerans TaxID=1323750 RepID=A0ABW4EJ95_9RHOB